MKNWGGEIMTYNEFCEKLSNCIWKEQKLKNPGKGVSTIKSITQNTVTYIRGNSAISIKINELFNVYSLFRGKRCTTNDLRNYKPNVFDSKANGHSCNCTILFMVFKEMLIIKDIEGKGCAGYPFYINIE